MDLNFSYQNRRRSIRAENYLADNFKKIETIASQVDKATAELIIEPDGYNVVQLAIDTPKTFAALVSARHENLHAAMHEALSKLKRKVIRIKGRFISSRRQGNIKEIASEMAVSPAQDSIDASVIIKFESAKKRKNVNLSFLHTKVSNKKISDSMSETATRLKCFGAKENRVKKYEETARIISDLETPIDSLVQADCNLSKETNIDKAMVKRVTQIAKTNKLGLLDALRKHTPKQLEGLLAVKGLGPKRVKTLYDYYGINSIQQLETAAIAKAIRRIPGFGPKLEMKILKNLP